MSQVIFKTAPYNPPHLFVSDTFYMLTASTYKKVPLIISPRRKTEWRDAFLEAAKFYRWQVIAWTVLHNHYHAVLRSPGHACNLSKFVNSYHKYTAQKWNREDASKGRKVWWNYWDTCIRSEQDYQNRIKYVLWNSVKHGLAEKPEDYNFSNYCEYLGTLQNLDTISMAEVSDVPQF